jgi:FtsZ-interacting cell division protein ZipA
VNAEFNWWLLIVGLVVGAAIVYLVLADSSRRESEIDATERPREAAWISASLRAEGRTIDPETAERVLELHRLYRSAPPPDEPDEEEPYEPEPYEQELDASPPTHVAADGPDRPEAPAPGSRPGNDPDVERH